MVLGGPDGPNLEKILNKIDRMFEGVSTRQEEQRDRLKDLETSAATIEGLRAMQDQMRSYVDEQNTKQTGDVMDLVDAKLGSIRQGVMADTEQLLRTHLNAWMEEKLKPMVHELIEVQEEKAKAERSALLRMWRERAALATAVVVLLWAIFNPFSNASDARDASRIGTAIDTLDEITH